MKIKNILILPAICCGFLSNIIASELAIKIYQSDLPFEMPAIQLTQFPDSDFNIIDFGAIGDGHNLNTNAFAKAIQACSDAGGGRVVVPAGLWLTGPIILRSNVNLYLEKGSVIQFSSDFEDYPIIATSWEGEPLKRCIAPIYGKDLQNIAITGSGIIDGAGDKWRPVLKWEITNLQWNKLIESGGVVKPGKGTMIWWPSEKASNGKEIVSTLDQENAPIEKYKSAGKFLRPVLVSLVNCRRVLLDGPTFQNSPAWNIHPLLCQDVIIRNITVRNPWYSTNGDGLDLESCKNVLVYKCRFDVGDDAICLKSGKNEFGRKRGIPSENIIVADCIVYHGHGGFVIGSEMSGGVRNVLVRDCVFLGTDLGLRFKSRRGRGGVVENIYIKNILMENIVTDALRFNTYYQNTAPTTNDKATVEKVNIDADEKTPEFRKISISDVICRGANRAVFIQGLPEMPVSQIELNNIYITSTKGLTAVDADQIKISNSKILSEEGPVLSLTNSRNIQVSEVEIPTKFKNAIQLSGKKTKNIIFKNYDLSKLKNQIKIAEPLDLDTIIQD